MADTPPRAPMQLHLEHLAADADDVVAMLTARHEEGGDLHPEALPRAQRLQTSLRDLVHALSQHEHLAFSFDDVWQALSRRHEDREVFPPDG